MRPEYKGTPKLCREPDGVQLGMRAFSHALVIKSAQCTKTQAARGLDTHVRHSIFPTDPS